MKQAILAIVLTALCLPAVYGQSVNTIASSIRQSASTPSSSCSPRGAVRINGTTIYICPQSGTANWTAVSGGSGFSGTVTTGNLPYVSASNTLSNSPLSRTSSTEVSLASGAKLTINTTDGNLGLHVKGDPNTLLLTENLGTPGQPLTQSAYWREGVRSYSSNTGAIIYNPVRWGGWNVSAPATVINSGQPAIWYAWEGSYDPSSVSAYPPSAGNGFPWFEPHLLSYKPPSGSEIRLLTYTIQPGNTSAPGTANGYAKADHRATLWDFQNLESQPVLGLQRGALSLYGATGATLTLSDAAGLDFSIANTSSASTVTGFNQLTLTQSGSPSIGQPALLVNSVSNRFNTILSGASTGGGWHLLTLNNSSAVAGNYASQVYQFGGSSVIGMGAYLRSTGPISADFYLSTTTDAALWVKPDTKVGFATSGPGKQVEINSTTGAALRLTYNDADGSAANKADFDVSSGGNLTIAPSGGTLTVTNAIQSDASSTADDTRFLLWDVTAGAFKRVVRGATDSCGTGYRCLRIAN